jgi:hypothetical protein
VGGLGGNGSGVAMPRRSYRRKVVEMNPGDAGRPPGMARRQATVLESVEEIRAQIRGMTAQE